MYTDFHGFMAELHAPWFDNHLIQDFVPSIEGLKEKLGKQISLMMNQCILQRDYDIHHRSHLKFKFIGVVES